MKKVSTTKSRLMGFFILVAGTSLLISMFTMIFSMVYNYRYQYTIEQMTIFNEYYENLDDAMAAMKRYAMYEEKEEYRNVKEYMSTVKDCLTDFSKRTNHTPFFREVQDVIEMTEYLEQTIDLVYKDMEQYHDEGKETFSVVSQKYDEVNGIYEAINEEYHVMNRMILGYIDEMYLGMQKRSQIFIGCFGFLFLGMFGILFLQIRNISHSISRPIQRLTQEAAHIREGELEEVTKLPTDALPDQDLKMLTEVFNDMVMGLRRQIEMMKENERVHKELEASRFKELQMQINPHFMFNTLNMISDTAYLEGAEKTVYLLDRTAKMFRFSLDFSGKEVTLFREIEELGNYVYVQEQRFGDRIRFLFELDESFHHIKIPSFILQPLVENAITHGVGMMRRKAEILIKTVYDTEEDTALLVVADDGVGMDQEKVLEVQREMEEYTGSNMKIGLGNVYLRMKMFFGNKMCMKIQSEKERGTKVTIQVKDALKDK